MKRLLAYSFSTRDPFKVLGITKPATTSQIKQAYYRLSKKYHPDINKHPDAPKQFHQIHQAYKQLLQEQDQKLREEFSKQTVDEFKTYEEQMYFDIFGKTFQEDPQYYYAKENEAKRGEFEELIKEYRAEKVKQKYDSGINWESTKYVDQYTWIHNYQSQDQDATARKRNMEFVAQDYDEYRSSSAQIKYILFLGGLIGLASLHFIFREPKDQETLKQTQISKLREKNLDYVDRRKEKVKNLYSADNDSLLKYTRKPNALEELVCYQEIKYTVYPDLKFYYVSPSLFYVSEHELVTSNDFVKTPLRSQRLNTRISHALEAERCLKNIFVKIEDVKKQISEQGYYKPPGVFMKFFGYIYFQIRKIPVRSEVLEQEEGYVSVRQEDQNLSYLVVSSILQVPVLAELRQQRV